MNRLVRGSVILAAAAVSWACGGLDTDGIDQTAQLVADPSVVYVANNDSQAVFVEALNDLGQQLEGNFAAANIGAGLSVTLDATFAPRPGVENLPTRVRFFVRGTDPNTFVASSFDVTANGETLTIPVRITPSDLQVTFSNQNPAPGDTVTLTAPANVLFTSATTVTVSGTAQVVSISADSTQISVVFATGNVGATATINNVVVTYLPGQLFNLPVTAPVTTDTLGSFPIALSNFSPNFGAQVTATLPAPFKATPTSVVVVAGGATVVNSISADSSTVVFQAGPNANGVLSITNLRISGAPTLGPYTLTTGTSIFTTPVVTSVPGTFSTATPNVGDTVTFTAGAGFKVRPTATVTFGTTAAIIAAVAADSSSIRFLPAPGSTGTASVVGALISGLAIPLTLPTAATLTVTNTTIYAGTASPATSPVIPIPALGDTTEFYDTYVGGNQFYKLVVPANVTLAFRLSWVVGPDIDAWFCNAACTGASQGQPGGFGAATGANPENLAAVAFTAGTYNVQLNLYAGTAPAWVRVRLIRTL